MALGDSYNNNKQNYSPTVYSQYRFSNAESKVDATSLSASFWNSLLKLSISPRIETQDGSIKFDHENNISSYLSHTKARLLHDEIKLFMENPHEYNNVGVDSGAGLIQITNGKEFGVNGIFITIKKINQQTGQVENSFAYQFKTDYHYAIRNYNEKDVTFDKVNYANIEIEQFLTLLEKYYEAMTGALAYSVIDNSKYDNSRMNTKIDLVMDKLGVERKGGYKNGNNKSSNTFFNGGNSNGNSGNHQRTSTNFSSSTIDDIENEIG